MGKLTNGIMGPFTGKVGGIVGSSWKGIPYVKSQYRKRTKKVTKTELANRSKFGMSQHWLQPVLEFVREGFRGYTERVEGFVAAKSWLLKNSFENTAEGIWINPALVKVSHGNLSLPADLAVTMTEPGRFQFTWNTALVDEGTNMDQIMMLAYDIESKTAFPVTTGQFRSTGKDILMAQNRKGMVFHIYAAFVAHDRSRQSDSVYLGEFKI